jgi:hypothetical protein
MVKSMQKFMDIVYQDAIENTYSHEQMTPLNPIMNNSTQIKQKLIELFIELLSVSESHSANNYRVEGFG